MWATLLALVLGGVVLFAFRDETPKTQYFKHQGFVFGTYYNIRYSSTESREEAILRRLDEFDKSLSTFNPHSTISVLNQGREQTLGNLDEAVDGVVDNHGRRSRVMSSRGRPFVVAGRVPWQQLPRQIARWNRHK